MVEELVGVVRLVVLLLVAAAVVDHCLVDLADILVDLILVVPLLLVLLRLVVGSHIHVEVVLLVVH